jgi:hypothetical protein
MKIRNRLTALVIALGSAALFASASADAARRDDSPCHRVIDHIEQATRFPRQLLSAVALAESGRWDGARKAPVAWPWTLNVAGKGRYYATKAEAVAAVHKYRSQGIKSIDVGCMQISLLYHGDGFASIEHALDPVANVAYGATLLAGLREQTRSWSRAVSYYHNRDLAKSLPYRRRVYQIWREERRRAVEERRLYRRMSAKQRKN